MPKKLEKFIIDVIPLTRIPLNRQQFYSYLWKEKIPVGSLVSIPLFRRTIQGIVVGNRNDFERFGNIKLKKIEIVLEKNFLNQEQIELANFISEYYFSSLGKTLKFFVPQQTKERINKEKKITEIVEVTRKKIKLTQEQQNAVTEIINTGKKQFLLFGPSGSGKTEVYIHSILKLQKKNPTGQFLILLPELSLTPQAIERYSEYFHPSEIVRINSKISKGRFYSDWKKIQSGEAKIIIGTRMAIFAPFKNLKLIIVDEEQDNSFKQWDMSPRYDAKTVAEKMTAIYDCTLVLGSATPSLESYFKSQNSVYSLLKLPILPNQRLSQIDIVDMKKERWNKNYSSISKVLKQELNWMLQNNFQSILFINRQGVSAFSICENCKTVLKCPRCERSLVYDHKGEYQCLHCNYTSGIFPTCQKCKHNVFKNIGIGTQKIEREITELFPKARIARADNQTAKIKNFHQKLYEEFRSGKIDILIGTQMTTKGWDFPSIGLVGILDTDNLLSIPDFRSSEKAFQDILQVAGRSGRPGSRFPGRVIIQTYRPESHFFKKIATRDVLGFMSEELEGRAALAYPPLGQIIKLILKGENKEKIQKTAIFIYNELKKESADNIKISAPNPPLLEKIRNYHRVQIILKIRDKKIPLQIQKILKRLDSNWVIDVDPISIT